MFIFSLTGSDWEDKSEGDPYRHRCSKSDCVEGYLQIWAHILTTSLFVSDRMDYGWFHSNQLSSKATRRASSHQTSWSSPDCTSHWCVSQTSHNSDITPCVHVSIFSVWLSQHHEPMNNTNHKRNVMQLSVAMGNITLVLKGEQDLISDGSKGLYHTQFHTHFWPNPTKNAFQKTSELIIVSVLVWLCVFSDGMQRWRQWEEMWWTGGPSVWLSGSFGSLGSFCLHSWNNKKVNNELQGKRTEEKMLQADTKSILLM